MWEIKEDVVKEFNEFAIVILGTRAVKGSSEEALVMGLICLINKQ